jgi:hypothetical protein
MIERIEVKLDDWILGIWMLNSDIVLQDDIEDTKG